MKAKATKPGQKTIYEPLTPEDEQQRKKDAIEFQNVTLKKREIKTLTKEKQKLMNDFQTKQMMGQNPLPPAKEFITLEERAALLQSEIKSFTEKAVSPE